MSDTFGSLIDKLFTIDMKLWVNQDELFEVRKISFEEFKKRYFENEKTSKKLWSILKKTCDLNVQRNDLIDEIDKKLIEIIQSPDKEKFIQKKHKTY